MKQNSDSLLFDADDAYIGRRIKDAREEFGLTQEKLGDAVGVEANYINRLENGKKHASDQLLRRIGKVTCKPMSFFYGDAPLLKDSSEREKRIVMMFRSGSLYEKDLIETIMNDVLSISH